jgi:nucleotide-binding universal stress UspA family protein
VTPAGVPTLAELPLHLDDIDTRHAQTIEIVDAAVARLRPGGEGSPGREIVNAVERDWHDLTVVGVGSSSWLGNRLLGSVSTYLLHSSPSSVLVVHERVAQRDGARVLLGTDGSR